MESQLLNNTSTSKLLNEKTGVILNTLKKTIGFPLFAIQSIIKSASIPLGTRYLSTLEDLTVRIQKKTISGIKLSTSEKILHALTGSKSTIITHESFMQKYLTNPDAITQNQKRFMASLLKCFPEKSMQHNVMISKGGLLSKFIRGVSGAGGVVNVESKDWESRNIIVNGNINKGTEQFFYVHETIHHIAGLVKDAPELEQKLSSLLQMIQKEYNKNPQQYENIKNAMLIKYPQHKDYFQTMDFYGGTNVDELMAESYSNPIFREFMKSIEINQTANALDTINQIMNNHFKVDCFQ